MPSVGVKLYSVFFKFLLKHRLQNRIQSEDSSSSSSSDPFGVTTRPEESVSPPNPLFTDGVATKDIHIDPLTSLSVRIFLPESALSPASGSHSGKSRSFNSLAGSDLLLRRNSHGSSNSLSSHKSEARRSSYAHTTTASASSSSEEVYRGYAPSSSGKCRKLPVMLQFHGGGWVSGSNDSVANDFFCRRMAKHCDVIVLAVGYRLAPENRYPAACEDGFKVLQWLGKQANLAECNKSMGGGLRRGGGGGEVSKHVVDAFGASLVEPWLASHADPSRYAKPKSFHFALVSSEKVLFMIWYVCVCLPRCVLLGVSCGANIADYVSRKAIEAGQNLDPVKVVAQVLMYPFFIGTVPTQSEIKQANSYFYDKPMCILAWKLFLPEEEFSLDHPAANPLVPDRGPPLKFMPPTLTIVAEHDWMRDRAIAYSEELRKVNVDAPVLEYKDAVHEFATLDMLLRTPQAQACAEDIAIWVKKYISLRGHEFSY
ncbi:hypothetical protein HID58_007280 [Brassica napus]|uniref:Alpha/beta hydrolase fold-3 domain-containing protein n=1 Tax=Brassica napus TaxID=3708 RepID=A0ABQ8EDY4_BRANA|nr:hypothetical protein HID58_007280 [Brassica napus]